MATELSGLVVKVTQEGVKETERSLNQMADAAERAESAAGGLAGASKKSGDAAKGMGSGYSAAAQDARRLDSAISSINTLAAQNARGMRESGLSATAYTESMARLKEQAQAGGASMKQLADASIKSSDGILRLHSATGETLASIQRLSYSAREAGIGAAEYDLRLKELSKTAWKNGTTLKELNGSHIEVTGSSYHLITAQGQVLTSMARSRDQIKATANEADFFNGKINTLYRTMDGASGSTGRYNMSLTAFDGYAKRARQSAEDLAKANAKVAVESVNAGAGMDSLSRYLAGFVTLAGARSIIAMSDTMTNMNAQIRLTTSSTAEFNRVQGELVAIAGRTYTSLEGTADLYSKTAQATKGLGVEQRDILKYTEAVNYAMAISGANSQQQASVFLQLSQAMNSGRMSMQDYKAIMAQVPMVMHEMAAALGINIKELEKMILAGDLTAKSMLKVGDSADKLGAQTQKMPITMGQAITDLKNNLLGVNDQLTNTSGVMSGLAAAVSVVAKNLDIVVPVLGGMVVSLAVASGAVTKLNLAMLASPMGVFAGAIGLIAANTDYAKEAVTLFAGVMAGRYLAAIVASNGALASQKIALIASTVATGAASVVTNGFSAAASAAAIKSGVLTASAAALRVAFAFLGGPVGVITLAVVALGAWAMSAASARRDTSGLSDDIERLVANYKDLTLSKAEDGLIDLKVERERARKSLGDAHFENDQFKTGMRSKSIFQSDDSWNKEVKDARVRLEDAIAEKRRIEDAIILYNRHIAGGGAKPEASVNTEAIKAQKDANDLLKEWRENNIKLAVGEETFIINKLKAAGATDVQVAALQREADKRKEILDKQKESNRVAKERVMTDAQLQKSLRLKSAETIGGGASNRGTLEMAKSIQDSMGKNLKYFSAMNDQYHQKNRPNSLHTKGLAFDAVTNNRAAGEASVGQITKYLESLGFVKGKDFFAQFEKAGEKGATGDHLHFQWQNKAAADRFASQKATGMKYGEQMGGYGGKDSEAEAAKQYASALGEISKQINGIQNARNDLQDFGFESQHDWLREFNDELNSSVGRYSDLNAEQKKALSGMAEIKANREQMLGIEKFAASGDKNLDALRFENSLLGKTKMEVEKLTWARQFDQEVQQLSAGMAPKRAADLAVEADRIRLVRDELVAAREEAGRDWGAGVRDGLTNFVESAGTLREQFASATSGVMDSLGNALGQFAATGKMNFRDMTSSIMADLAKIAMRMAMMNLVSSVAGAWAGGSTPVGAQSSTIPAGGFQFSKAQAMGGAWSGGVQMFAAGGAFTNSVVNSPTAFAHAGGLGVMGEAGPEAIMPLTRGSNGKLGVVAHGGGSGGGVSITINNNAPVQVEATETRDDSGNVNIELKIEQIASRTMVKDFAGNGPGFRALQGATGIKRRGY